MLERDKEPPHNVRHGAQDPLLSVRGVSLRFGGLTVLSDVDLTVDVGHIHGLVGPNGAGKTSLFNCVSGLYRPHHGSIELAGQSLLSRAPSSLVGLGVARTFQHPSLDPHTTVLDNVLCGAHTRLGRLGGGGGVNRTTERAARTQAGELLHYVGLGDQTGAIPGSLPYADQKKVELVRALMCSPRLLLLDEPAGGLTHGEVHELGELISQTRHDFKVSILVIEHHMGMISAITDRVDALVGGRNVTTGTAAEVQNHPVVIEAYLGAAA